MIKSMTGYGKANQEIDFRKYQVEIKSVNHRYLDISVRLPRELNYLEDYINSLKKEYGNYVNDNYSEEYGRYYAAKEILQK